MWIFFWSKSYFCVHNFSFSALSEQECVQCALFLIWSLSDLSDVTGVALHNCTGAVSSFYSLLIFQQRVGTALVAYATELHTHSTRLNTSFALCKSLLFMIWLWKPYAPNKRTRGVFSSLFTFTPASLAGWQLCTAGTDRSTTRLWEQLNTC